ncbi:MAG: restriction endonuclease subunit R [Nitrospinota bacterium]
MAYIPKKVSDRFSQEVAKFQRILASAKNRDLNEADTVMIVTDILSDVFGFDKYTELTGEFAIKNLYCDLAVKIEGKVKSLIEVKAVGLDLKENHLRQALEYGATQGIQWIILTNGIFWEVHRVNFQPPLRADLVCQLNFLELNPRKAKDQEMLFLFCKEGLSKDVFREFHEHQQIVNRFTIGAIVLGESVLDIIRRELKKISPGVRVDNSEIEAIIKDEVLKRDAIEGEMAKQAMGRYKKVTDKLRKAKESLKEQTNQAEHADESKDNDESQGNP